MRKFFIIKSLTNSKQWWKGHVLFPFQVPKEEYKQENRKVLTYVERTVIFLPWAPTHLTTSTSELPILHQAFHHFYCFPASSGKMRKEINIKQAHINNYIKEKSIHLLLHLPNFHINQPQKRLQISEITGISVFGVKTLRLC